MGHISVTAHLDSVFRQIASDAKLLKITRYMYICPFLRLKSPYTMCENQIWVLVHNCDRA